MRRAYDLAGILAGALPDEIEAALELERPGFPEMIMIAMHLRRAADPAAATVRAIALRLHPERLPISDQRLLPEYIELAADMPQSDQSGDIGLADLRRAAALREARLALNSAAATAGLIVGRNLSDAERAAGAWLLRYCNHGWITCVASGIAAVCKIAIVVWLG